MITKLQKLAGVAISLLMVLCFAPNHVLGSFTKPGRVTLPKNASATAEPNATGRLVTRGNQPVLVNGYGSYSGTTILTGATIQTPTGVRATIQLADLGSIDLAPNTTAVVDFSKANVKGTLKRGCAVLITNPEVTGVLVTPDGDSKFTEKAVRSSVTSCSTEEEAAAAEPAAKAAKNPWIFDLNPSSTIDMLRLGMMWGASRGRGKCCCCCCCNPSPSSPTDCGCR